MSRQETGNISSNNMRSNNKPFQLNFNSNQYRNEQMHDSNENNYNNRNKIIINNAVINNFNNNNQINNNFSDNKNNLEKNYKNTISFKCQGAYKKSIIKSNLNASSNHKKNTTNKTAHMGLVTSQKHIEEVLGSPYIPKTGVKTTISSEKKIKPNNLLKSMNSKKINPNNIQNNFAQNMNKIHNINNPFKNINQSNNLFNNVNNNGNKNQQIMINNRMNNQNNQKINFQMNFPQQINRNQFQQVNKFSHVNKNQINEQQKNFNQNNIIISNNNNIQNSFRNQNQVNNINQSNINSKNNSNSFRSQTDKNIIQKTNQAIKNNNQQFKNQSQINNNNSNKLKPSTNYSFSNFKKAALTGLKNLGATSYLNSVLQLIGSIRSFASYFLNPKNGNYFQDNLEKYPIAFVTHRLCVHLYPYPEKRGREIYTPDSYMCMLGNYNWVYKDYKEKDPRMLLVYILNKIHDELNEGKSVNNNFIENNLKIAQDRDATINLGLQNMMKSNNSIIFNYFNWFEIKETKCMNCSNEIYNFLNFSTFELNIFDLARFKRLVSIKLEDCLDFYAIPKIKKKYCYFCKSYKETTTSTQIFSSPNIFIFLLNLEKKTENEESDNINFIIEKEVNLGKFIENKSGPSKYELIGMVYLDKSKNKYCTLCRSPVDFNWYLYEDENVSKKNYDLFIQQKFNKSIYYKPCILMYKNVKS